MFKFKQKYFIIFFVICFVVSFFLKTNYINAGPSVGAGSPSVGAGSPSIGAGGEDPSKTIHLPNPISPHSATPQSDPQTVVPSTLFSRIIKLLLGGVGTLSLAVFIYGGGVWLTSGGNQEQVKKGKDVFIYALVGLAVVFGSYAILNLIISALMG